MEIRINNILNIVNEDPEDLYVAKHDIEKTLKAKDDTYQRKTLGEFIQTLELDGRYMYLYNGEALCFSYKYDRLFVTSENQELIDHFLNDVAKIKYDTSNLKKISIEDIIYHGYDDSHYFMINKEIYEIPE